MQLGAPRRVTRAKTVRGYCYHLPLVHWKTETLVRKWREHWGTPQQRAGIAYTLAERDPALARGEVLAHWRDPAAYRRRSTLRRCAHHVADAELARELLEEPGFDPDALPLTAYLALVDDLLAGLPSLPTQAVEERLARLGLLDAELPNPMGDSDDCYDRYAEGRSRAFRALYDHDALRPHRRAFARALRETHRMEAHRFLLERWVAGEASALDALTVVPRLGTATVISELGTSTMAALVEAACAEIGSTQPALVDAVLRFGWFPGSAPELGPGLALRLVETLVEHDTMVDTALATAVRLGEAGSRLVLRNWQRAPHDALVQAAGSLPHRDVAGTLPADHPALLAHPGAPPNRDLLRRADELLALDPPKAFATLVEITRATDHPDRSAAIARVHEALGSPALRKYALHALGEIGDPNATPALIDALEDPALASSLLLVLGALQRAADERAVGPLRKIAASERYAGAAEIAIAAIQARHR